MLCEYPPVREGVPGTTCAGRPATSEAPQLVLRAERRTRKELAPAHCKFMRLACAGRTRSRNH